MSKKDKDKQTDFEIRLFERRNRNPDLWLAEREAKVKEMIEGDTFRGFGKLEHIVEADGATTWRTKNATEHAGHHSG